MPIKLVKENDNLTLMKNMLKGDKGDPGDSAYQIALEKGFEGTEEEWLASLQGKDGVPGVDGKDGAPFTYEDFTPEQLEALKGADGKDGKDGVDGAPGKDGEPGKDGKDGKDGEDGVYVGSEAPDDNTLVWIDPDEETDVVVTLEEITALGYQTEAQVKALINAALTEVENGSY